MRVFLILLAVLVCSPTSEAQAPKSGTEAKSGMQLTLDDLRTFTDVFNQLRTNYVDEVDDHTLLTTAIRGMINSLDPYSEFLDSDQSRRMEETFRGRYGGIGIRASMRSGRIVVDELTPGGPAENAGVQPGDLITAVDGIPVRERKMVESIDALSGTPGTLVTVRFKSGNEMARDLELERAVIPVPSVSGRLIGEAGYFQISHFHRESHIDLEEKILAMQELLGAPLNGVILDLRDNPGGIVRPAVAIADGFLDEGLIVHTRGRYEATRLEFRATPGQWIPDVPLVLLVNRGTASASEVLTGALKDNERALVIGEKTFGKGSIQSIFNLRNGSALKLTTAHYFTPSGETIHENGIDPNIMVEMAEPNGKPGDELQEDRFVREALHQLGAQRAGKS